MEGLPLTPSARGEAVRDLQRRLAGVGFAVRSKEIGIYGDSTVGCVRGFQQQRGLDPTGTCERETWSALVEAGYQLGDRQLYLRSPMLRGDDVADLQRRLGALGFDAGRVDGIFGGDTVRALEDFQRNMGLAGDGICGSAAIGAMVRLGSRTEQPTGVAGVREREHLRCAPRVLAGRRVVVGEAGGQAVIAGAVARLLREQGAVVALLQHHDGSAQAREANRFEAEMYLGIALDDTAGCDAAYFATEGFESSGGHRLADLIVREVGPTLPDGRRSVRGMWLPILRETQMPAVLCSLGPPPHVVEYGPKISFAFAAACETWAQSPLDNEPDDQVEH